jgi:hypothetical protein
MNLTELITVQAVIHRRQPTSFTLEDSSVARDLPENKI